MSNKDNIREIILIGRDRDCNFICNDTSVSRHHAQIIDYSTSYSVVDLDSTNGTFVNGRKVSSETTLHAGDLLRVGNVDIPWQQLVQPLQEPESNKKLLWILMPIIAALLIGGVLAVYFVYGHAKDKDEKLEKNQSEIVGDLAKKIIEIEGKDAEIQNKTIENDNLQREKHRLDLEKERLETDKMNISIDKNKAEAEKIEAEKDREKAKAEAAVIRRRNDSIERVSDSIKRASDSIKRATDSIKQLTDSINQETKKKYQQTLDIELETVMAAIDALSDEDVKEICRDMNIVFNVRLTAKEALKEDFRTSNIDTKHQIAKAIKEKQKSSNNDKK